MKGLRRVQLGLINQNASYVKTETFLFFQGKDKINQEKKKSNISEVLYIWHID